MTTPHPAPDLVDIDALPRPRRRLSYVRLLLALLVLSGVGAIGYRVAEEAVAQSQIEYPETNAWDAPYVDVTVTPYFPFEDPGPDVDDVVLSFVVAHRNDPCAPAWGAVFGLDDAAGELDLDRRIVRLRQTGRDVLVSFGGAINDELATVCTEPEALEAAYGDVVERYDVTTIDLDIEGPALADREAHTRRAEAIAAIQETRRGDGHELAVWLTVPVAESGMTEDGVALVDATLAAGVDLAGVNLMTMNFGSAGARESTMAATESAVESTVTQVLGSWRRAGRDITPTEAWARIGVTPMLGRNDIVEEVFDLDEAVALTEFVQERGLARLSYWSLNRDRPCGSNEAPLQQPSNHCSHLDQDPSGFAAVFAPITGRAGSAADGDVSWATIELLEDDPERSPYPIWTPDLPFLPGEKTVWHGYVYEAKWWTMGDDPEAPVANIWESPWRLVGPVLAEDLVEPVFVPAGIVDSWQGDQVYNEGDQVWFDGIVYEAKWWTAGFQPNRPSVSDWENPWRELDPELFLDHGGDEADSEDGDR